MPIKVEVFTSEPPCSGGRLLLKLIEKIKDEYKDKIKIEIYRGANPKLGEYGINASPAVVIDKDIRIIGVCSSEEKADLSSGQMVFVPANVARGTRSKERMVMLGIQEPH